MFEIDFRNNIVLFSLIIHSILLWILFRYGRKNPGGKSYLFAILAIAAWIFPMMLFRMDFLGMAEFWGRILYAAAALTATTFLIFTFYFPRDRKVPWWIYPLLLCETFFIIIMCFHPDWMIRDVIITQGNENVLLWGPFYFIYAMHISGLFSTGLILLLLSYKKEEGKVKNQVLHIFLGYFFGSTLAMVTNLILPWLGYFNLNWSGQFFSTAVAVFTTYAILRHNLLNIKVIATEAFVIALNLVLFIQLFTIEYTQTFIIQIFISVLVLVISYVLIKSVKREVEKTEILLNLTQDLEQANIKLQEMDRTKTEFLSIASHQLRTPLSIIKGYLELLKDGAFGITTPQMIKVIGDMDESNERLVKLVDEFLDITRIEQGRTKFTFQSMNMNDTIESIIKELHSKADAKNLQISWTRSESIGTDIIADEEKIRHVAFNFIDNAIKYSEKGIITILLEEEKGGLTVKVKDNGIGFTPEDAANFFTKFYRGKNVEGTNVNGTGLGIYVCRKFVEGHEGHVWCHSEGLGKGSEFGFWIPKDGPSTHTKEVLDDVDELGVKGIVNQYSTEELLKQFS